MPRHPSSTLFPYTTLFRSSWRPVRFPPVEACHMPFGHKLAHRLALLKGRFSRGALLALALSFFASCEKPLSVAPNTTVRSEEHTSELQSRRDLVCRLLLEK